LRLLALSLVFISNFSLASLPAESEIGFTKASMAFQEGKTEEANQQVDALLKKHPEEPQVVELKALLLKSQGEWEDSKKLYLKLIKKAQALKNEKKIPLYAFELGNLFFSLGDLDRAHRYLRTSVKGNFNVAASEFLLGKIDLEQKYWIESRAHFEAASKQEEFRLASKLLIAQSFSKENRVSDAVGAYVEAKESALEDISNSASTNEQTQFLAQQVLKNSEKELRSFDKSQWISEVGLSTGYDSNVLFMPNVGDSNNTSTTASAKQSANWRLRYGSNPTKPWQYLGSYQGSINYNYNREAEAGQFIVQELSNFLTRGSLKTNQYGFKLGATGIFQYQTDAYKPFSLTGSIGPFAKMKLNDGWTVGVEAFFQPVRNYLDPSLSTSIRRSGWEQVLRGYLASRTNTPYWTPSIFLTGTLLRPSGSDFSGTRLNLDFANSMYLASNFFLAQTFGVSATRYPNRTTGERNDQGFSVGLSSGYQISQAFALIAQVDYGQNFSSDTNFRYRRWATTVSGNFRF